MRLFTVALIVAGLTACSTGTYFYYPPGGTDAKFQRDSYECMREAQQPVSSAYVNPYGGAANSGTTTNSALANACMRARGYREGSPPKR